MCLRAIPILTFSTTTPHAPGTGIDRIQVTIQTFSPVTPRQCLIEARFRPSWSGVGNNRRNELQPMYRICVASCHRGG